MSQLSGEVSVVVSRGPPTVSMRSDAANSGGATVCGSTFACQDFTSAKPDARPAFVVPAHLDHKSRQGIHDSMRRRDAAQLLSTP